MNAFQSELKVVEMEKVQGVCSYGRCGGHGEASDVITRTRHVICLSEHKGDKLRVKWFDDGWVKKMKFFYFENIFSFPETLKMFS